MNEPHRTGIKWAISCLAVLMTLAGASFLAHGADQGNDMKQMADHLAFMGYACTIEDEGKKLQCTTDKPTPNFTVRQQNLGFLIAAIFKGNEQAKEQRAAFLNLVNEFNILSIATRYYVDKDTDLVLEAWLPGVYRRDDFTNAVDNFNNDWSRVVSKHETELKKFIK